MSQPLAGLTVIDLSGLAGCYGTRMMAALGADVVKIEPPSGSPLRRMSPFVESAEDPERSLWWAYFAMGTRSVVIDIDDDADRARLAGLLETADVVIDDHGPDVLNGYGVGHEQTCAVNPAVIWVSISAFGLHGPKRDWRSSNLLAWAASGVLYTTGFEDEPPVVPGGPAQLGMHAAALNAAVGVMVALRARRMTGRGQLIDVSLAEACLAISPETGVPVFLDDRVHRVRSGNRRTLSRPFGLYPCSDGYVSILVLMPRHWEAIAQWVAEECDNESITDPVWQDFAVRGEAMELIDDWVEELTTSMTLLDFFREGQRRGIPITPVNTVATLAVDPHLEAAGYWQETELPGGGTTTVPGRPFRGPDDWWQTGRAPRLGEHTDSVLG